jgi:hypothetical protein
MSQAENYQGLRKLSFWSLHSQLWYSREVNGQLQVPAALSTEQIVSDTRRIGGRVSQKIGWNVTE